MKASVVFTVVTALIAKIASADSCWSQDLGYPCCQNSVDVRYTDKDGLWGVENGNWCGIVSSQAVDQNQQNQNQGQDQNQNQNQGQDQNQNQNQGQDQNQQNQNQNQNQGQDQNQQNQNQGQDQNQQNQNQGQDQNQQNQNQNQNQGQDQNQQNQNQNQNQGQDQNQQNQNQNQNQGQDQNQQNQNQNQNQGQDQNQQNQNQNQGQDQNQQNQNQNQGQGQDQNQQNNQNQQNQNQGQDQNQQNQNQSQGQDQNQAPVTTNTNTTPVTTDTTTSEDTGNTTTNTTTDTTSDTTSDTTTAPVAGNTTTTTTDTTTGNTDSGNTTVAAPSGTQFTHSGNPFAGHEFFINPYYTAEIDAAIAQISDSELAAKAEKMKTFSNAIWLDSMKNMNDWLEKNLKGALAQQDSSGKTVLTVFVVYDLPGRDCHALASNGELLANESDMERYKSEYIDIIEGHLKTYNSQPVVLIIEPDSLANMVTNIESTPACADSQKYYLDGHAYLIQKFGVLKHVAMYLDIGHAFWLGWDDNRQKASKVYSEVIASGAPGEVRGFADNVANYTPWEDPTLSRGPDTEWNPCPDEKRYLEAMYQDFTAAGIKSVYFVSDTSRNGKKTDRKHPGEWCNQTGVGIGARPQASPISGMDYLDAFYWVKPLGESDGTSDESAERYDGYCGHETAMKPAPEAGQWFQAHFEEGIKNANPPL